MKVKSILFILVSCITFTSCHGDLDIIQKSEVSANSMWQTEEDATSAMYGLYNQFRKAFSTGYIYWGEYRTGLWGDGLTGTTSNTQVYQNQIPIDHSYANWADLYTTINAANLIIRYTPSISFNNEENKNKVMANAYFVRAFCYYWIARIWGDAPIVLEGFESDQQDDLYPTRQPIEDVFKQVEDDLTQASILMPTSITDKSLASKGAINMLTADYNLWMYKVQNAGAEALNKAETAISSILNSTQYSLESDYANIFKNEMGNEIIFAWPYIQDEYTGGYPSDYLVPNQYVSAEAIENPVKIGSHQQWCFYTEEYKALLSENPDDQRTIVNFETYFDAPKNTTFQWINKYSGTWSNGTRIFDSDIVVYRYADAILFDAEIKMEKNNINEAINSLNRIAERAYGETNFYPTTLDKTELNKAILRERQKEFAAEGKLWWDYIRLGVVFQEAPYLIGRENEQNILLWPISQTSINKNPNLIQTPGYDK